MYLSTIHAIFINSCASQFVVKNLNYFMMTCYITGSVGVQYSSSFLLLPMCAWSQYNDLLCAPVTSPCTKPILASYIIFQIIILLLPTKGKPANKRAASLRAWARVSLSSSWLVPRQNQPCRPCVACNFEHWWTIFLPRGLTYTLSRGCRNTVCLKSSKEVPSTPH